jgi:GT2 family glycosyltransferase
MTRVAVIIPTWNRRELVQRAMASVLSQAGVSIELVVVDDGSTDGTVAALAGMGDAVRCLPRPHQGRSAARNTGFRATSGDCVVFLDSDDILLPGALLMMSRALAADEAVHVVVGEAVYRDLNGRPLGRVSEAFPTAALPLLDLLVLHNVVGPPHAAMIRRTALDRLGPGPFDETLHGGEDHDLWIRLAAAGCRFKRIDADIAAYTLHEGNESSPRSPNRAARDRSIERGMAKVLAAPWFAALAPSTRRTFLWQYLTKTLGGRLDDQERVLSGTPFRTLPPRDRSALLRQVAVENFVSGARLDSARQRLRQSVRSDPTDAKSIVSLALATTAPGLWRWMLERRSPATS